MIHNYNSFISNGKFLKEILGLGSLSLSFMFEKVMVKALWITNCNLRLTQSTQSIFLLLSLYSIQNTSQYILLQYICPDTSMYRRCNAHLTILPCFSVRIWTRHSFLLVHILQGAVWNIFYIYIGMDLGEISITGNRAVKSQNRSILTNQKGVRSPNGDWQCNFPLKIWCMGCLYQSFSCCGLNSMKRAKAFYGILWMDFSFSLMMLFHWCQHLMVDLQLLQMVRGPEWGPGFRSLFQWMIVVIYLQTTGLVMRPHPGLFAFLIYSFLFCDCQNEMGKLNDGLRLCENFKFWSFQNAFRM